jgi:hypothetical protein
LFWQVPDALILSLKRRIKHSAWLYMLRFIATFLTNWHITPWQHNTSINRNKSWNSYLVCAIRHCSPACLVHNFRCQWYTVLINTFCISQLIQQQNSFITVVVLHWSWSYSSWVYIPMQSVFCAHHHLRCEFEYHSGQVYSIQHYVIKFELFVAGQWFSPVFSTNKSDRHDIIV